MAETRREILSEKNVDESAKKKIDKAIKSMDSAAEKIKNMRNELHKDEKLLNIQLVLFLGFIAFFIFTLFIIPSILSMVIGIGLCILFYRTLDNLYFARKKYLKTRKKIREFDKTCHKNTGITTDEFIK